MGESKKTKRCSFETRLRPAFWSLTQGVFFPQPKLSMAKCRRNVENFLDACKKMGVPQVDIIIIIQTGIIEEHAPSWSALSLCFDLRFPRTATWLWRKFYTLDL